ncbi:MAG: GIY-YIG nuclease family protein [Chloroflexi bacterium]|nr:GIY-YIG nuclease family protein [Chloroflexota bacterium]
MPCASLEGWGVPERAQVPPSGTYLLMAALSEATRLRIGALGQFDFPAGCYLYVGRAKRGLAARLERHHRQRKRLHWHIDYLLTAARIQEVWVTTELLECAWAGRLRDLLGSAIPVPGFGSSDCRCPSHLVYVPQIPRPQELARLLPGIYRLPGVPGLPNRARGGGRGAGTGPGSLPDAGPLPIPCPTRSGPPLR